MRAPCAQPRADGGDVPACSAGLCRTCEVFGAAALVVGSLQCVSDKQFQQLSVSAEQWLPLVEVGGRDLRGSRWALSGVLHPRASAPPQELTAARPVLRFLHDPYVAVLPEISNVGFLLGKHALLV